MQIDAARVAKNLYGIDSIAASLPGEYDNNFHLRANDGREFTLKIMREGCDRAFIEMQCAAMKHLGDARVAGEIQEHEGRLVWVLHWLPGKLLADTKSHSPELLRNFGRALGRMDAALSSFDHLLTHRELKWDLKRAGWALEYVHCIEDPSRRKLAEKIIAGLPPLDGLRHSVIHGDANDHNVVVRGNEIAGLIDFGYLHYSATVCDLAIACAYVALGKTDPLAAISEVVRGYEEIFPLEPREIELLFPLILTRLAVSVTNSAHRKTLYPDDPYVTVSEKPAWRALETLSAIHPRQAQYTFRTLKPTALIDWIAIQNFAPIVNGLDNCIVFDLSVGSLLLGANPSTQETSALTDTIFQEMRRAGAKVGIGRYNEARLLYSEPQFASGPRPIDERRTIHLGLDLFCEPGSPVYAPLDGSIYAFANNKARLDYGPMLILRHQFSGGEFFTLYGHLSVDSLEGLTEGKPVKRGQQIAKIGAPPTNGDWPPHLHFQIVTDLLDRGTNFPGVAFASQRELFTALSPDPNLIVRIPLDRFPPSEPSKDEILVARRDHIGANLSISYDKPLKIVRGWKQYLYDDTGRAYLDLYNNVPLVGHSHPRVVEAVQRQIALLNTNTRYLHGNITRYAERLCAKLPAPLKICYFLNSASEANELALRLARAHTGREDVIVLDAAYHGNTTTLIDISPYKFSGHGGTGKKPWVHVVPIPDDYRGPYKRNDPKAGLKYAHHVEEILTRVKPAAYIAESLPSVGGQIVFPKDYLPEVYRRVRALGGVCIADEVQVGFGRLGDAFWGFEMQNVIPDIVVLGKPIGNGFPLAAVITTPEIAKSFNNGMEFFSTFGGNPVACAAGLAVLDVLEEEKLPQNATCVGKHLLHELTALLKKHEIIGDVRGSGLFLGIELIRDRNTLEPAAGEAGDIVNRLRERGILTGTDGPHHNVLKLRPPLCFTKDDADCFVAILDEILD